MRMIRFASVSIRVRVISVRVTGVTGVTRVVSVVGMSAAAAVALRELVLALRAVLVRVRVRAARRVHMARLSPRLAPPLPLPRRRRPTRHTSMRMPVTMRVPLPLPLRVAVAVAVVVVVVVIVAAAAVAVPQVAMSQHRPDDEVEHNAGSGDDEHDCGRDGGGSEQGKGRMSRAKHT